MDLGHSMFLPPSCLNVQCLASLEGEDKLIINSSTSKGDMRREFQATDTGITLVM